MMVPSLAASMVRLRISSPSVSYPCLQQSLHRENNVWFGIWRIPGNSAAHEGVEGTSRMEQNVQRHAGIKVHEGLRTPGAVLEHRAGVRVEGCTYTARWTGWWGENFQVHRCPPQFPLKWTKAAYCHKTEYFSLWQQGYTFLSRNILGNALVLDTLHRIMGAM